MTHEDYVKISGECVSDGAKGFRQLSCSEDSFGVAGYINIVATWYDNDACLGGRENINSQSGEMSEFNTFCNDEDLLYGPYSGSEQFRCVKTDQLPFKVDEANTYVDV